MVHHLLTSLLGLMRIECISLLKLTSQGCPHSGHLFHRGFRLTPINIYNQEGLDQLLKDGVIKLIDGKRLDEEVLVLVRRPDQPGLKVEISQLPLEMQDKYRESDLTDIIREMIYNRTGTYYRNDRIVHIKGWGCEHTRYVERLRFTSAFYPSKLVYHKLTNFKL